MLVDQVREYTQKAFQNRSSPFGIPFFDHHIAVVVRCSRRLACHLGADVELAEVASYLHDISVASRPDALQDHARLSAEIASGLLAGFGCESDRVTRVSEAILLHSNPLCAGEAPPEAVCLSNADAAARILEPAYWLYYAFVIRRMPFAEGRAWLRSLTARQWDLLIEPARNLVREPYELWASLVGQDDAS